MVQKQKEALEEQANLEPKVDLLVEKTRDLQKLVSTQEVICTVFHVIRSLDHLCFCVVQHSVYFLIQYILHFCRNCIFLLCHNILEKCERKYKSTSSDIFRKALQTEGILLDHEEYRNLKCSK